MNVTCRVCLLEIQFSLGQQYSVVFYYNKGNMKVNLIQLSFLRNNQANDYLGTKTHLFITLKVPVDCSIQPTLLRPMFPSGVWLSRGAGTPQLAVQWSLVTPTTQLPSRHTGL